VFFYALFYRRRLRGYMSLEKPNWPMYETDLFT